MNVTFTNTKVFEYNFQNIVLINKNLNKTFKKRIRKNNSLNNYDHIVVKPNTLKCLQEDFSFDDMYL